MCRIGWRRERRRDGGEAGKKARLERQIERQSPRQRINISAATPEHSQHRRGDTVSSTCLALRDLDDFILCNVFHDVSHVSLIIARPLHLLVDAAFDFLFPVLPRLRDLDLLALDLRRDAAVMLGTCLVARAGAKNRTPCVHRPNKASTGTMIKGHTSWIPGAPASGAPWGRVGESCAVRHRRGPCPPCRQT